MAGSYLDTTIVIALAGDEQGEKTAAEAFVASNTPAKYCQYTLRELLAGHLSLLCAVHNRLVAAQDPSEVLNAISALSPLVGRKKGAQITIFAAAFARTMAANPEGPRSGLSREMRLDLASQVSRMWYRARK